MTETTRTHARTHARMHTRARTHTHTHSHAQTKFEQHQLVDEELLCAFQRLGKEVMRQLRDWRKKGSRGTFMVQKRRGTLALEDMGLLNLSGAVSQLAWEKDLDFSGTQPIESLSPRSPAEGLSQREGQGQAAAAAGPGGGVNGGPGLPNGSAIQRSEHQQLVSTPTRRIRSLVYNRVAPLLPPLPPQEDGTASNATQETPAFIPTDCGDGLMGQERQEKKSRGGGGASVMALDLKSISSWGDATEHSISEETSRSLLSPRKEPGVGGFKEVEAGEHSPGKVRSSSAGFKDVELGKLSPRQELYATQVVKDVESGVGMETAHTQSEISATSSSPQRSHRRRKKKSKGSKHSREGSPKKSPDVKSESPLPPTDDFDSLGRGSQGRESTGHGEKDSSEV